MKRRYDWYYAILFLAVIAAIAFIIMLSKENSRLKSRLVSAAERSAGAIPAVKDVGAIGDGEISGPPDLLAGDLIRPFSAREFDGKTQAISFDGKQKYFFLIFSPNCPTCRRQIPLWQPLLDQAKTGGYKSVALSLDAPGEQGADDLKRLRAAAPVLMMPDMATQRTLRVTGIPELVLLSGDGKVEWVNYGPLSEGQIKELSDRLRAAQ